jgi:hypothetical protein
MTIDEYLDELADALDVSPRRARRILAEAEDHLRETTAELSRRGMRDEAAEREAIARFGSAKLVAARFSGPVSQRAWFFRAYLYAALLGGIVLIAAGIAGELSAGFGLAFGESYVSGDTNGVAYTPARCADFFEYHPLAASCEAAATLHHFDEIWRNADLALVLGIVVVAAHLFIRRRYARGESPRSFPRRMFWIIGMAGFGGVAPLLALYGVLLGAANGWSGSVLFLAGAGVAAIAFLAFLRSGWSNAKALVLEYAV